MYTTTPQELSDFPVVIIEEIDDGLKEETLSYGQQKFKKTYEINIYTTDKVVGANKKARQEIAKELSGLANNVFDIHYGFNRKSRRPVGNIDKDVFRLYMRFDAVIDSNKKIYRK